MGNQFAVVHATGARRHWTARAVATLAAVAALTALAGDASAKTKPARPVWEAAPRDAGAPIMGIVSIKTQQVTFYDADGWILRAPVSTGVKGRETPAGVFAVIEKDKDHHSTLYDDAWMPNMLRITWNGIALHGGPLPGYAASHGCVRMPYDFAENLFDKAQIGMRVIISPDDEAPIEFSHPALFEPNAAAVAAAPAHAEALARDAEEAVKTAAEAKKAAAAAAREAAAQKAALRKVESLKKRADAQLVSAKKAVVAADQAKARAEDMKEKATAAAADLAAKLEAATADATAKLAAATAAKDAATTDDEKKAADAAARDAAALAASVRKLEAQKAAADARLASAEKAVTGADQAKTRAADGAQKAAAKAEELAAQLAAANADMTSKLDAAAAAKDAAAAAAAKKDDTAKAAIEAKLALEPVSVYISRATQTLYVRRNTHKQWPDGGELFDSTIEVPVTIRDPDKPIGTHVFTAMAANDAGLRWTAVTIDRGDDAKDALDRITIPRDVLDRIAPTALPRSSIIVSDEPLSRETNYRTEFVVVLNDQPQGGFLNRKPTAAAVPAVTKKRLGLFRLLFPGR